MLDYINSIKNKSEDISTNLVDICTTLQHIINNNEKLKHLYICKDALGTMRENIGYISQLIVDIYNLSESEFEV